MVECQLVTILATYFILESSSSCGTGYSYICKMRQVFMFWYKSSATQLPSIIILVLFNTLKIVLYISNHMQPCLFFCLVFFNEITASMQYKVRQDKNGWKTISTSYEFVRKKVLTAKILCNFPGSGWGTPIERKC